MKILLVVDVQNDFCPGGALAVPEGDKTVTVINELMERGGYDLIVASKDWHPADHKSFASNHPGESVFSKVDLNGIIQTLWPNHCVQGTEGANFHPELKAHLVNFTIHKGQHSEIDSYSAFYDNAKLRGTGLKEYLERYLALHGIDRFDKNISIDVVGLATDYCVKFTAIDAHELGFQTRLIRDACRGVNLNPNDEQLAVDEMKNLGIEILSSRELLAEIRPDSRRHHLDIPLHP